MAVSMLWFISRWVPVSCKGRNPWVGY